MNRELPGGIFYGNQLVKVRGVLLFLFLIFFLLKHKIDLYFINFQ